MSTKIVRTRTVKDKDAQEFDRAVEDACHEVQVGGEWVREIQTHVTGGGWFVAVLVIEFER